jgi:hypothetical protein
LRGAVPSPCPAHAQVHTVGLGSRAVARKICSAPSAREA